ncbi:5-oxoprolinase subunit B family protein [Asanoa iriomotensis]|uniref:Allophanate hydrolase n=1 Tax=Asanoa iriomotensis TaxID=234613 RepID=A0ABQ4C879_9ACTN|nr:allophanate hydrolase subunit 1 [Asanoa iriomotensis]GIF58540.1 allophanate hydrolase [Asanoa iriomotensis]
MRIHPVGATALLIECPADEVEAWRAELWRRRSAGSLSVAEIVPGARTVLLDGVDPLAADLIMSWAPPPAVGAASGDLVEIPTVYDGPDLSSVAALWSLPVPAVISRLASTTFRVAFCGFAPGFGYLTGLPAALSVPRLATPRTSVPPGSVGLAGPYAGIYPTASPGGWQLVGRTSVTLFDVSRDPPALLVPGTVVRLVAA